MEIKLEIPVGSGKQVFERIIDYRYQWLKELGQRAELKQMVLSPLDWLALKYEVYEIERMPTVRLVEDNIIRVGPGIECMPGLTVKPVPIFPPGLDGIGAYIQKLKESQ